MKIYLAGKIDKNDWRHSLVSGLRRADDLHGFNPPCWSQEWVTPVRWPILKNALPGNHDYCGPYFIGCDHGCYHFGGSHGVQQTTDFHGQPEAIGGIHRSEIARLCGHAIIDCDAVFAWIDSLSCYGSLVELGMAAAYDKIIYVAYDVKKIAEGEIDDLWLLNNVITSWQEADNPVDAFVDAFGIRNDGIVFESPIEEMFYDAWMELGGPNTVPLKYQHNVQANGSRYRLDFAIPSDKIGIELDGYEYHNSKEQFTRDRVRDRQLQTAGWSILRFSGSEVYNNAEICVEQVIDFVQPQES